MGLVGISPKGSLERCRFRFFPFFHFLHFLCRFSSVFSFHFRFFFFVLLFFCQVPIFLVFLFFHFIFRKRETPFVRPLLRNPDLGCISSLPCKHHLPPMCPPPHHLILSPPPQKNLYFQQRTDSPPTPLLRSLDVSERTNRIARWGELEATFGMCKHCLSSCGFLGVILQL